MKEKTNIIPRPPVVVVMGHIDHGKSTLLDYIRKTNIVDGEAGGITQHISAYVVDHKSDTGEDKKITFLDTPGHEAFSHMRERGAVAADIAILVVSAEDSVKAQTIEAWNTIVEGNVPFVVAINKIDKPNANPEKVKLDLAEKGIYLEGYGGDIPFALVSAKSGAGIGELLDVILLVAEMKELTGDISLPASGVVIESHLDQKRGISATLIVKNGTLRSGDTVVIDDSSAPVRIFEDFRGKTIKEAGISTPVRITGFTKLPTSGGTFVSFSSKKDAEKTILENKEHSQSKVTKNESLCSTEDLKVIPVIIKADVAGVGEAVLKEIKKLENDCVKFKILANDVGLINENDIKLAQSDKEAVILGFNTKLDTRARDANERAGVTIQIFDVIYKMSDFVKELMEERKPRKNIEEVTGRVKIIKFFSATKERQVVGGKVTEGKIVSDGTVRILRRDFEIGRGKIIGIEHGKVKAREVLAESECGILIESKSEIAAGDVLESFITTYK